MVLERIEANHFTRHCLIYRHRYAVVVQACRKRLEALRRWRNRVGLRCDNLLCRQVADNESVGVGICRVRRNRFYRIFHAVDFKHIESLAVGCTVGGSQRFRSRAAPRVYIAVGTLAIVSRRGHIRQTFNGGDSRIHRLGDGRSVERCERRGRRCCRRHKL